MQQKLRDAFSHLSSKNQTIDLKDSKEPKENYNRPILFHLKPPQKRISYDEECQRCKLFPLIGVVFRCTKTRSAICLECGIGGIGGICGISSEKTNKASEYLTFSVETLNGVCFTLGANETSQSVCGEEMVLQLANSMYTCFQTTELEYLYTKPSVFISILRLSGYLYQTRCLDRCTWPTSLAMMMDLKQYIDNQRNTFWVGNKPLLSNENKESKEKRDMRDKLHCQNTHIWSNLFPPSRKVQLGQRVIDFDADAWWFIGVEQLNYSPSNNKQPIKPTKNEERCNWIFASPIEPPHMCPHFKHTEFLEDMVEYPHLWHLKAIILLQLAYKRLLELFERFGMKSPLQKTTTALHIHNTNFRTNPQCVFPVVPAVPVVPQINIVLLSSSLERNFMDQSTILESNSSSQTQLIVKKEFKLLDQEFKARSSKWLIPVSILYDEHHEFYKNFESIPFGMYYLNQNNRLDEVHDATNERLNPKLTGEEGGLQILEFLFASVHQWLEGEYTTRFHGSILDARNWIRHEFFEVPPKKTVSNPISNPNSYSIVGFPLTDVPDSSTNPKNTTNTKDSKNIKSKPSTFDSFLSRENSESCKLWRMWSSHVHNRYQSHDQFSDEIDSKQEILDDFFHPESLDQTTQTKETKEKNSNQTQEIPSPLMSDVKTPSTVSIKATKTKEPIKPVSQTNPLTAPTTTQPLKKDTVEFDLELELLKMGIVLK